MAKSLNDTLKHSITCSQCSQVFEESLSRLKTNPVLACPSCGHKVQVRYESDGGVERLDDALAKVRNAFNKGNRRR